MRNFQISCLRLINLTSSECQISYHWKYVSFLGPSFLEWGISTCFNVECVLLGRNFDFFDGYFGCYCSMPGGYCSFPLLVCIYIYVYIKSKYLFGYICFSLCMLNGTKLLNTHWVSSTKRIEGIYLEKMLRYYFL